MKGLSTLAIGHKATAPSGSWAIGDDVDAGGPERPGILYVGQPPRILAIGSQVFGRECNLRDLVLEFLRDYPLNDWRYK